MPRLHPIFMLAAALVLAACNTAGPGENPDGEKFIPYKERLAQEEQALRRKLKVRETTTEQGVPEQPGRFIRVKVESFDPLGNLVTGTDFDGMGKVKKSVENTWDGDLLRSSEVKNEMGQSYKAVYTYNDKGQKLNETLFRPSGDTLLTRSYTYDAKGNEVEARLRDRQRNRSLRKTMTYDATGRPATIREFQSDSLTWEEDYAIEDKLWTVVRRNHSGEVMGIFKTEFDGEGRALRIEQMAADSVLRLGISYEYDSGGRLLKERHYGKGGAELQSIRYSYLENGLLNERVLVTPTMPAGIKTRWEYKLDGK